MTVSEVFAGVSLRANLPPNLALLTVTGLEYDSRRVRPGSLFFAFEGQHADGRRFAADAIGRGALAVVSQTPRPADFSGQWIEVEHGRRALALAAVSPALVDWARVKELVSTKHTRERILE